MPMKSTNTFSEWLQSLMGEISKAKLLPDALPELSWITNLETVVLQKAHDVMGTTSPGQMQPTPVQGPPMGGPPMGGGGDPYAGMPGPPPPQQSVPGGVMPNAQMPSPDELRRVLQQSGG